MIYKENLAVVPSEFRRLSVRRLIAISDYLAETLAKLQHGDDPDYSRLASELNSIKLSLEQIEYSFDEIAKFLESLSDKVNSITEEKAQ